MPKRRTHDSNDRFRDVDDNPIGLTGAFAPVRGPQSVDYDKNDDPVGLTSAFGAIPDQDEPRSWDEAGKWKDFDWDAAFGEPREDVTGAKEPRDASAQEEDAGNSGDAAYEDEASGADDAPEQLAEGRRRFDDDEANQSAEPSTRRTQAFDAGQPASASGKSKGPKHGRHVAPEPEISPRMKRSKRTRKVLIVLVILLVVVIGALGYFMFRTFSSSQQEAAQQTQEQTSTPRDTISSGAADDAIDQKTHLADVPNLSTILGKTQDEALAAIGRGALVTQNREVNEEGNPIKVNLNVALTEEAADSKTGTPTVYLGLGEEGTVRQVGYSASASALGFGALSFADAVSNEHVVEKTFQKAGVNIPEGSASLPADKAEYSTYASDGKTVVRERCSFGGETAVAETPCEWSAVLSYDYTTQVVTGNLADTVRVIYVYLTMM